MFNKLIVEFTEIVFLALIVSAVAGLLSCVGFEFVGSVIAGDTVFFSDFSGAEAGLLGPFACFLRDILKACFALRHFTSSCKVRDKQGFPLNNLLQDLSSKGCILELFYNVR
jgi:hypothetical protein